MKKNYLFLLYSSTFFLSGMIGLQVLAKNIVLAEERSPIVNPLHPDEQIEPIEVTLAEEQVPAEKPIVIEPNEDPRTPEPELSLQEKAEMLEEKIQLPIANRRYMKKTFVNEDFFKESVAAQPDNLGDDQEKESELSKICYVLSGKLLMGRKGNVIF